MQTETHKDRRALSLQMIIPFVIIFLTNLITAYGTVQVLKAEITFLTKTADRHENEIKELRKEHGKFQRAGNYGVVAKAENEIDGRIFLSR